MDTPVGNLTIELPEGVVTEVLSINAICRLCGNQSEKLTGIYSEDGIRDELANKINSYLPIKICETDELPLQCCWNCVSALLTWHNLLIVSLETDRRLKSYQLITEKQLTTIDFKAENGSSSEDSNENPRQNNTRISLSEDESSHSAAESCRYPKVFDHSFNCTPYPLEISSKYPLKAYLQDKETINKNANTERTDQDDVALDFSTNNKYSCESCAINFPSSEELNRHRDKTHVKTAVELICTICNTSYETKVKLKMHLKKSHDVSQPKTRRRNVDIEAAYFCDVCDKGFTRKYDMQKHRKIKHVGDPLMEQSSIEQRNADISSKYRICVTEEGKPVYKCDLCDRLFRQSYNLMRHRSVHTGVKDFVCHICAKTFRVATNLSRHINEFHFGVKKYACEQCGKKFKSRTTKNEHANIHYNHRPFVCDVCGKSFKQKSSLRTHKLFHGDNFKFECNLCDRKFRRRQDLKLHGWLHTGYKPNACGICKATFRLSQDLKRHCRTHQKRRECVCEDCGSSFTHERYLEVHRKIHMYTINNKGTQV